MTAEEAAVVTLPLAAIEANPEALIEMMATQGMVIVTGVASADECAALEERHAEDVAEVIDVGAARKAGGSVWKVAREAAANPRRFPMESLQLLAGASSAGTERESGRGLPHGRFAWRCRMLPGVRRCYEILHDDTDLVSGVDNAFFAPETHKAATENPMWPHCDFNQHDKSAVADEDGKTIAEWDVYQGVVYVWDAQSPRASTTVVWPGSHREPFDALMSDAQIAARGHSSTHFSMLGQMQPGPDAEALMAGWRAGARRVPVPAGAMLLWSSRTVHQGWSGGPRLAQPVCWEPRRRRSFGAQERKCPLACLGLPSTHWASLGKPHTALQSAPRLDPPTAAHKGSGGVVLPLRSSLTPVTLVEGVGIEEVWALLGEFDWTRPLPAEARAAIQRVLRPEYAAVL